MPATCMVIVSARNEDMGTDQHRPLGFGGWNVPRAMGRFEQIHEDLHT